MTKLTELSGRTYGILSAAALAVAALVLLAIGRLPICACGTVKLWHGVVASSENSQHLTDWYTFSHLIHGFGFYLLFWRVGGRGAWPLGLRFLLAVVLESGWEILENTPLVIDRYRAATISLDYYGDSVVNSLSDIAAMGIGFLAASRLPVRGTIALAVLMELLVGYWIRDNLTLNLIQLIHPIPAILRWQQGG